MAGTRSSTAAQEKGKGRATETVERLTCFAPPRPGRPETLVRTDDPLEFVIAGNKLQQLGLEPLKDLLRVTTCAQGRYLARIRAKKAGDARTPKEIVAGKLMDNLLLDCRGRPWQVQEVYERFGHFLLLKAFSGEIPKVDPRDAELFERLFVGEPQGVLACPTTDTTDMKYVRSVVSRTSV